MNPSNIWKKEEKNLKNNVFTLDFLTRSAAGFSSRSAGDAPGLQIVEAAPVRADVPFHDRLAGSYTKLRNGSGAGAFFADRAGSGCGFGRMRAEKNLPADPKTARRRLNEKMVIILTR
ncbi:MAG: hypothetical protein IJQ31_12650 [Thermoguttaceae bacterium]|nr:hypothetical protein [Thermoguttaceae bacterium]